MSSTYSFENDPFLKREQDDEFSVVPPLATGEVIDIAVKYQELQDKIVPLDLPSDVDVHVVNRNTLLRDAAENISLPLHFDRYGFVSKSSRYDIQKPESRRLFNRLLTYRIKTARTHDSNGVTEYDLLKVIADTDDDQPLELLRGACYELNTIIPNIKQVVIIKQGKRSQRTFLLNPKFTLHPIRDMSVSRLTPQMIDAREEYIHKLKEDIKTGIKIDVVSKLRENRPELKHGSQLEPLLNSYFMKDGHLFEFSPQMLPRTKEQVIAYYQTAERHKNLALRNNTQGVKGAEIIEAKQKIFVDMLRAAIAAHRHGR